MKTLAQTTILVLLIGFASPSLQAQWTTCEQVFIPRMGMSVITLDSRILVGTDATIFLSTDLGSTWAKVRAPNNYVYSFAVSGSTIFAATVGSGVYRSTDQGSTWQRVNNGITDLNVWHVAANGSSVFAGTNSGIVFRSIDNGNSWTPLTTGVTASAVAGITFIGSSAYVAYRNGQVYQSTNNGDSWTLRATIAANLRGLYAVGTKMFAGSTTLGAFASTDNGATWTTANLSGMVRSFSGTATDLLASTGDGVYRSTNNGISWSATGSAWTYGLVWGAAASNGKIFAACDYGLAISPDNGATWSIVSDRWEPALFSALGANGSMVFGGSMSFMYTTSDLGSTWTNAGAMGNAFVTVGGKVFAGANGVFATTDNGASWTRLDSGLAAGAAVNQNALAANGGNLYVGTNAGTYLSTNSGAFWSSISAGLTTAWGASGFAFNGSTILAGTFDYGVYRSTNNGGSWAQVTNGLTDLTIYALCANGSSVLAASASNGVFRTTDNGANWSSVNTGLAPQAVNQFAVVGSQIYAASLGDGVYVTNDNGAHWASAGLHGETVHSIVASNGNLFAASTTNTFWCPLSKVTGQVIVFQADLSQLLLAGFDPAADSVVVNGNFNGWNATRAMRRVGSSSIWVDTVAMIGGVGDTALYKFRMLPGYRYTNDGWEIGNDRKLGLTGTNQTLAAIAPAISIVPLIQNDVTVTMRVDMNNAHESYGNTPITNVRSVWIAGDPKPLLWPGISGWIFADTVSLMMRMYDDGTHGDPLASDGIWSRTFTYLKTELVRQVVSYKFAAVYPGVDTLNAGVHYLDNELPYGQNRTIVLDDAAGAFPRVYQHLFGVAGSTSFIDSTAPSSPQNVAIAPGSWSSTGQYTVSWTNPIVPTGVSSAWYRIDAPPTPSTPGTEVVFAPSASPSISVNMTTGGTHPIYLYLKNGVGKKDPATAVAVLARYDNAPPTITHDSATVGPVQLSSSGTVIGTPPSIAASALDAASGVKSLIIRYKKTSASAWISATFVSSGSVNIPAATFTSTSGVEYQVAATDSANLATTKTYSIPVALTANSTSPGGLLPAASAQTTDKTLAYRMISVPYELTNQTPLSVLSNLGSHESDGVSYVNWRLWRMDESPHDYEDFKSQNAFTPGKAYFLIVNDVGKTLTVSPGSLVSARKMVEVGIPLQAGWNSVGNPFPFDIPFDSLFTVPSGLITSRAYFSGTTTGTNGWVVNAGEANLLRAWQGLAIRTSGAGSLRFRTSIATLGKATPSGSMVTATPEEIEAKDRSNCLLRLSALRDDNGLGENDLVFGFAQELPEEQSVYNWPRVPMVIDGGVAGWFESGERQLMHEIQPSSPDGHTWTLKLQTRGDDVRVNLSLRNPEALTVSGWMLYLVDLDQRTAYDLRKRSAIPVVVGGSERTLRIVVGPLSFVQEHADGVVLIPSATTLSQNYPNPFNPSTTIAYALSKPAHVVLTVCNAIGQQVATLVDARIDAGYHEVRFDATGLATGIYLYRLQAGEVCIVKKLILLR